MSKSYLNVLDIDENWVRKHAFQLEEREWKRFIYRQKVSETFMREFQDYFTREDWKELSKFQQMSNDFRREMFIKRS